MVELLGFPAILPRLNFGLTPSYTMGRLLNLSVLWFLRDKVGILIVLTSRIQ